jgi:hypothetical protein
MKNELDPKPRPNQGLSLAFSIAGFQTMFLLSKACSSPFPPIRSFAMYEDCLSSPSEAHIAAPPISIMRISNT